MTVQTVSPHQVIGDVYGSRLLGLPSEAAWIMEASDRLELAGDPRLTLVA